MQNPRSVILAIIPANVDIATQEILEMAAELDVNGERTLGVLTKPDLVDKGAEPAVIDIIEGRSHILSLGWCIVRNPGQQALTNGLSDAAAIDRHSTEKAFFESERPWSKVSKDRVGITTLRSRLVEILADMIKREFPRVCLASLYQSPWKQYPAAVDGTISVANSLQQVKAEISAKLRSCKEQLDALGPSRATRDQQFKFLLELATQYQGITSLALKAQYGGNDVFDSSPTLKLATAIVSRNALFSDDVWQRGHAMAFDKNNEVKASGLFQSTATFSSPPVFGAKAPFNFNAAPQSMHSTTKAPANIFNGSFNGSNLDGRGVRYERNHTELESIVPSNSPIASPRAFGIKQWLEEVYRSSRGFELGTFDPSLLPVIWKKQSANWEALALGYVEDIVSLVHSFTVNLLAKICKDPRARQGLHSVLLDPLTDRYKKSIDHAKFLLTVERSGTPMTMNHYFADNLEKR